MTTTKPKDDNETSSSGHAKNDDSLTTFIESESMLYILVGLAAAVVLCSFMAYRWTRRKRAQWESESGKSGSRSHHDEESVVTRLDIARRPAQPPLTSAWQRKLSDTTSYMRDIDLDDDDMWWERATERVESRHGNPAARDEPPKQLLKRLTNLNLSPDLASPDPLADCGEWDMISEGHVSTRTIPKLSTRHHVWSPGEDVNALSNC